MDVRKRMSASHTLLFQDPDYKKRMAGTHNDLRSIIFTCFNVSLGLTETHMKYAGLKEFCIKYGLYFNSARKKINTDQDYAGWRITARPVFQLKEEILNLEPKYYVYVYLDPRKPGKYVYHGQAFSYEPFYVGKGGQGDTVSYKRWSQHLSIGKLKNRNKCENNYHKYYRINNILSEGLEPLIHIYQKFQDEQDALSAEKCLIEHIGRRDLKTGPLTNLREGGQGGALSEETKKKISESLKGNIPWNRFKTITEMQKKAISLKVSSIVKRKVDNRLVYVPVKKECACFEEKKLKIPTKRKGRVALNKGIKTNRPAWNRGLKIILPKRYTAEQKTGFRKSVLNQPIAQYTINNELVTTYQSQRDAARLTGYKREGIKDCCNGKQCSAYGFIWKKLPKENSIELAA